jgi:NADH:ubiquinone oxidoreductase subunit E
MKTKTTISVCTNHRYSAQSPSCGASGSPKLLEQLQTATQKSDISVESSCCFGHCTEGVVVKISPNGNFYHHVTESDIPTLLNDANKLND